MYGDTKIRLKSRMPATIWPSVPACYLKHEDKNTQNYSLASYLICMWQLASYTRGRTHSERVREWGAQANTGVHTCGSNRRLDKTTQWGAS